jgi:ribulose-phosphate 3-epimerase
MYIEEFVKAATANGLPKEKVSVTVHQEACKHLHRVIQLIKSFGVKAAVSINPATPVEMIRDVLGDLDMVLIMSVNPGFGGQKFIPVALEKIREIRKLKPDIDIEVDGGINAETAKLCIEAGANILVAGSYVFGAEDRKKAIESLR